MGGLVVDRFRPEGRAAVRDLILAGLEEHWGVLDPALNVDVHDLEAAYPGATVLVARLDERVVGVGVLVPADPGESEVKRMSVARAHRRQGIASAVLRGLVDEARAWGCTAVVLETTSSWTDAVEFYARSGFTHTHDEVGPFGSDSWFRLDL